MPSTSSSHVLKRLASGWRIFDNFVTTLCIESGSRSKMAGTGLVDTELSKMHQSVASPCKTCDAKVKGSSRHAPHALAITAPVTYLDLTMPLALVNCGMLLPHVVTVPSVAMPSSCPLRWTVRQVMPRKGDRTSQETDLPNVIFRGVWSEVKCPCRSSGASRTMEAGRGE